MPDEDPLATPHRTSGGLMIAAGGLAGLILTHDLTNSIFENPFTYVTLFGAALAYERYRNVGHYAPRPEQYQPQSDDRNPQDN
jgi:uncharacterized membrane protein YebE (DUF533 family)